MDTQEKIMAKLDLLLDEHRQALVRLLFESYASGFEDGQVKAYEKIMSDIQK
jgi:hypothetical protein